MTEADACREFVTRQLVEAGWGALEQDIVALLEAARRAAARSIIALMTASYWEIGRHIVEFDQGGQERAIRGQKLLQRLSADLQRRVGRGFSVDNLEQMRLFYLAYPSQHISETLSRKSPATAQAEQSETASRSFSLEQLALALPLPWSHYVHLVGGTRSTQEREFYEVEALRCDWSVQQLDRQISGQSYTRVLLSKNKRAMLEKGSVARRVLEGNADGNAIISSGHRNEPIRQRRSVVT